MSPVMPDYVARAALIGFDMSVAHREIVFSDFSIKTNTTLRYSIPDGVDSDFHFPASYHYIEIHLDCEGSQLRATADSRLTWATARLRLFKPGALGASLDCFCDASGKRLGWEVDPQFLDHDRDIMAASMVATRLDKSFDVDKIYQVNEGEVESLKSFVEDMRDAPMEHFAVALQRFQQSYARDSAEDEAIDLFVALESLFSEDSEAIGYKIALRSAFLLESAPSKRKDIFGFTKRAYRERSAIVHGKRGDTWLAQQSFDPAITNLEMLEDNVRRSLRHLLLLAKQSSPLQPETMDRELLLKDSAPPTNAL